jgi:hypothetical protein
MKKNSRNNGHMNTEHDFAAMKNGIRGKYYERDRKGTNVVLLEPDVAKAFPTENAANEALRDILSTTRAVRRTGGLTNRTLESREYKRPMVSRRD